MRTIRPLALFGALLVLGYSSFAGAQSAVTIKLQPAIIEERAELGTTIQKTIRVTNLDPEAKTLYLAARDITDLSPTGEPVFSDTPRDAYGVASWVVFPQKSIVVPPNGTVGVPVEIRIPETAAPGGHFGGIFFLSEPVRPGETGAGIGYEVGTILNLRLPGDVSEEARIREFRTDRAVYDGASAGFSVRVENLGNVLVRPRGPLEITNMFGKNVGSLVVNSDAAGIFPKGERTFTALWAGEGFAFGRYQATLGLVYGEDARKTVSAAVSFWVLPMKLIAAVLGGLLLLIGGAWALLRFYINRKIREARGGAPPEASHAPSSPLVFAVLAALVFTLILLGLLFFLLG